MAQGTIKTMPDRGYGFITGEEREDLFFHRSAVVDARPKPQDAGATTE
jgi:cold shock CspA family protein